MATKIFAIKLLHRLMASHIRQALQFDWSKVNLVCGIAQKKITKCTAFAGDDFCCCTAHTILLLFAADCRKATGSIISHHTFIRNKQTPANTKANTCAPMRINWHMILTFCISTLQLCGCVWIYLHRVNNASPKLAAYSNLHNGRLNAKYLRTKSLFLRIQLVCSRF